MTYKLNFDMNCFAFVFFLPNIGSPLLLILSSGHVKCGTDSIENNNKK